jgi:hypothetical protein
VGEMWTCELGSSASIIGYLAVSAPPRRLSTDLSAQSMQRMVAAP